eukprot:403334772
MSGFFFGITVVRWLFRSYRKSEFDDYPADKMIQICKFCQIIKDTHTVLYQDEEITAFADVRPLARNHILVVPKNHLRNINTLEESQATVDLLKKMRDIGEKLIKQAHENDVKAQRVERLTENKQASTEVLLKEQNEQKNSAKNTQIPRARSEQIRTTLVGEGKYVIGFHRSFATSIDHLHMHAFELPFKSYKTYIYKTNRFFFSPVDQLIEQYEKKVAIKNQNIVVNDNQ